MKYVRYILPDGRFTDALFTSEGDFIGGETREQEEEQIAAHVEEYSKAFGEKVSPVVGDTDPAQGQPVVSAPLSPEAAAARLAAEYEEKVQEEMRALVVERLAAKGIVAPVAKE